MAGTMAFCATSNPAAAATNRASAVLQRFPRQRLGAPRPSAAIAAARPARRAAAAAAAATSPGPPPVANDYRPSADELKSILLDSLYGLERGLAASSDARAEITELVSQLEAANPTPQPNEARGLLSGTWRLVYTSNSEVLALLALGRLPLVSVGDVTQRIDGDAMTVENRVELSAPLSKTALSATASFEVRSPQLLSVRFEEGRVATPELLTDVALPSSLEILGQSVDLSPLAPALQPLEGPLRGALGALGALLAGAPDLRLPLGAGPRPPPATWLLNTYLDGSLRITRGDGGSVYVLVKEQAAGEGEGAAAAGGAAVAGYWAGNASTGQPDWDAMEEQEPRAAAAAAAGAAAPADPVVEPSAVVEGSGSNGSGAGSGMDSSGAAPGSS